MHPPKKSAIPPVPDFDCGRRRTAVHSRRERVGPGGTGEELVRCGIVRGEVEDVTTRGAAGGGSVKGGSDDTPGAAEDASPKDMLQACECVFAIYSSPSNRNKIPLLARYVIYPTQELKSPISHGLKYRTHTKRHWVSAVPSTSSALTFASLNQSSWDVTTESF